MAAIRSSRNEAALIVLAFAAFAILEGPRMAVVRGLAMGAMFVAPLRHSLGRAAGAVAVVALVVVALGAGVGVPAGRVRARQPLLWITAKRPLAPTGVLAGTAPSVKPRGHERRGHVRAAGPSADVM